MMQNSDQNDNGTDAVNGIQADGFAMRFLFYVFLRDFANYGSVAEGNMEAFVRIIGFFSFQGDFFQGLMAKMTRNRWMERHENPATYNITASGRSWFMGYETSYKNSNSRIVATDDDLARKIILKYDPNFIALFEAADNTA